MNKGNTYLLRLPASLKAAVEDLSKQDGTSINQFITTAVAERVAAMKTAEFLTVLQAMPPPPKATAPFQTCSKPTMAALCPLTSLFLDRVLPHW